jgi:hypothetical protein
MHLQICLLSHPFVAALDWLQNQSRRCQLVLILLNANTDILKMCKSAPELPAPLVNTGRHNSHDITTFEMHVPTVSMGALIVGSLLLLLFVFLVYRCCRNGCLGAAPVVREAWFHHQAALPGGPTHGQRHHAIAMARRPTTGSDDSADDADDEDDKKKPRSSRASRTLSIHY